VAQLAESLSDRDLAILRHVAELRLMTARQLRALHFPGSAHESDTAAVRACHRVLARLTAEHLLVRLQRRIGGARAGSAAFIYAIGPAGQRVLSDGGTRRRYYEPTERFVDHTLAISQLIVDATLAHRSGTVHLRGYQAEPACWRSFSRAGVRIVLRPDLFINIESDGYAFRWWAEVDRSSESLPVVLRKCRLYASYYQSGVEQSRGDGTFPRVCWIAPDERRAQRIRTAIARDRTLPERLFVVTHTERALHALTGGTA
jgi:hypothetical protein